jgi:predicted O-methyltransferase YrrM
LFRLGRRKLIVFGLAVVVSLGAILAWRFGGTDALIAVMFLTTFGGLSGLGYYAAQAERRSQEALGLARAGIESAHLELGQLLTALDRQVKDVRSRMDGLNAQASTNGNRIEALGAQMTKSSDDVQRSFQAVNNDYKRLDASQQRLEQRQFTKKESADLFRQVEALVGLYLETGSRIGFPATRDWVASPDLLLYLYRHVRTSGVESILECGSGLSTTIMAYALRSNGGGRLVSLEHSQEYADRTNALLDEHELTDWAEVRLAPLEPVEIDGEVWPWYSVAALPDGPIDLLFVDGPPGTTRPNARFPALPLLIDRLSPDARILLDDFGRADESELASRWMDRFPNLALESLRHEKGTALLRLAEADRSKTSPPEHRG